MTPIPSHEDRAVSYADLLTRRAAVAPMRGLDQVPGLHPGMFHYQRDVTEYLLGCGRGAAFLDTGHGHPDRPAFARMKRDRAARRKAMGYSRSTANDLLTWAKQMEPA